MTDRKLELSKKLMLQALREYRGLFNKSPSDKDLETYAGLLAPKFEFKQVTWALSKHIEKGSAFFPSCGEIFAYLTPKEEAVQDKAPIIVNEIIQAIRLHPYDLEARMYAEISDDAKAVIEANGGTRSIRDSDNFETMKAQLERLARGVIMRKATVKQNESLEKIGIHSDNVIKLEKPKFQTIDFSGYLPDGDLA